MHDAAPNATARARVFHRSLAAMHTRFSLVLVDVEEARAEELAAEAERELQALERLMSRFDASGPLAELNRRAAREPVEPPEPLWQILLRCREAWQRTGGAFDITLWPVQQFWRECAAGGKEPAEEALAMTRRLTGMERVHFDERARTVRFEREGMSLDLGGFGKGYALERIARNLQARGVERALLSFGESSIAVLGAHPHGPAWPVGIANAFAPSQSVHTFQLKDASLSTSGTAPHNQIGGPQVLGQILDPRSGRPIEGYRTMSVACPSAVEAEVLSTALLVTPEPERSALLSGSHGTSAVEVLYHRKGAELIPRIHWNDGL